MEFFSFSLREKKKKKSHILVDAGISPTLFLFADNRDRDQRPPPPLNTLISPAANQMLAFQHDRSGFCCTDSSTQTEIRPVPAVPGKFLYMYTIL